MRLSDVLAGLARRLNSHRPLAARRAARMTTAAAGVFLLLSSLTPVSPSLAADTAVSAEFPRTVRVGFYRFPGYHDETDNRRGGYGFDFLQLLSRYANLNYDFVGYDRNWDAMQALLLSGEIDLLTSAAKTPEREALFAFSNPIGNAFTRITVRYDDNRFHLKENDYRPLSGLKIGVITPAIK